MANFNDDKTTEIPDFANGKDSTDSSIDMSIFKMSDDELYDDVPKKDDKKKTGKKKGSSTIILCLVVIAILIVTSIFGIVYALQQHNLYTTANDSLTQVQAELNDYKTKNAELNSQVTSLTNQIAELQASDTKADPDNKYASGTKLYITEDGGSQGVREKASIDSEVVTKNGSPYVLYWGDSVTLTEDATVDNSGNYWGKIDGGYIRIEYNGETWASTEKQ